MEAGLGCTEDYLQGLRSGLLHPDCQQEILLLSPVREPGLSERFETAAAGKTAKSDLQELRKGLHAEAVGCGLLLQRLPPAGLSSGRYR